MTFLKVIAEILRLRPQPMNFGEDTIQPLTLMHLQSPDQQRALMFAVLPPRRVKPDQQAASQRASGNAASLGSTRLLASSIHFQMAVKEKERDRAFNVIKRSAGIVFLLPENIFFLHSIASLNILFAFSPSACLLSPPVWHYHQ